MRRSARASPAARPGHPRRRPASSPAGPSRAATTCGRDPGSRRRAPSGSARAVSISFATVPFRVRRRRIVASDENEREVTHDRQCRSLDAAGSRSSVVEFRPRSAPAPEHGRRRGRSSAETSPSGMPAPVPGANRVGIRRGRARSRPRQDPWKGRFAPELQRWDEASSCSFLSRRWTEALLDGGSHLPRARAGAAVG